MEVDNLKAALDALLVANEGTSYVVLRTRDRSNDAAVLKKRPQVSTYIDSGEFPLDGSSVCGPYSHKITIKIDILATAAGKVDLSVLKSDTATPDEIASALAAATTTTAEADAKFDALLALLWNLIMQPENRQLGLDYDPNRWITGYQKSAPSRQGALALIAGSITMTADVLEYPTSETPVACNGIDAIVEVTADVTGGNLDSALQGVKVGR
jgi:hypothetical protein